MYTLYVKARKVPWQKRLNLGTITFVVALLDWKCRSFKVYNPLWLKVTEWRRNLKLACPGNSLSPQLGGSQGGSKEHSSACSFFGNPSCKTYLSSANYSCFQYHWWLWSLRTTVQKQTMPGCNSKGGRGIEQTLMMGNCPLMWRSQFSLSDLDLQYL